MTTKTTKTPQLKDSMVPFITREEIKELVIQIAQQIEQDYEGEEIVLICPLKGSFLFLTDLCRQINLSQKIEFIYISAVSKKNTILIHKDISTDLKDKHVIIVEEIIDTGRTLAFLKDHLLSSYPASLKIATLLDKPARRELPLRPDYIGKTIEDRYVVGYGMDSDQFGRNYSDIYVFPS